MSCFTYVRRLGRMDWMMYDCIYGQGYFLIWLARFHAFLLEILLLRIRINA